MLAHRSRCSFVALFGLLSTALWVGALGCGRDEPVAPEPPRPNSRLGNQAFPAADQAAPTNGPAPEEAPEDFDDQEVAAQPIAAEPEKPKEEKPPRNYGAELAGAVGGAESCIKPRSAETPLPEKTTIDLEAYVMASGSISRGYARSSVLTPEELECVKGLVERAQLPPEVENPPLRVDTSITLTFKRPETPGAAAPAANAPPIAPPAY